MLIVYVLNVGIMILTITFSFFFPFLTTELKCGISVRRRLLLPTMVRDHLKTALTNLDWSNGKLWFFFYTIQIMLFYIF